MHNMYYRFVFLVLIFFLIIVYFEKFKITKNLRINFGIKRINLFTLKVSVLV